MATGSVQVTAGSGTPIRIVTNAGVDGGADQQVFTLADSAGNLLGTPAAPLPTSAVGASTTVTGTAAALNTIVDGTTDLSNYSTVRVQISGTWVGTLTFTSSGDGTIWNTTTLWTSSAAGAFSAATGNSTFYGPIPARYLRAQMTSYTSGTATVTLLYTSASAAPNAVVLGSGTNLAGAVAVGATSPSAFTLASAASTNATSVKAAAGNLQEVTVSNPTATVAFFKLYNLAAAPTVGTSVPIATYRVAATGAAGDTVTVAFGPNGKRFTTGIAFAITGAAAATDATAAVAGIQVSGTYV